MGKSHYRSKNTVRVIQNRMPIYDSAQDALLESENFENYVERCCHKLRYSDEAGNQIYTFKYYINFHWNFISMCPKNIQMSIIVWAHSEKWFSMLVPCIGMGESFNFEHNPPGITWSMPLSSFGNRKIYDRCATNLH